MVPGPVRVGIRVPEAVLVAVPVLVRVAVPVVAVVVVLVVRVVGGRVGVPSAVVIVVPALVGRHVITEVLIPRGPARVAGVLLPELLWGAAGREPWGAVGVVS